MDFHSIFPLSKLQLAQENGIIDLNPVTRLIARLAAHGVRYGREDSFKLSKARLLGNRVLIGIESASLEPQQALALASELGMPAACLTVLLPHAPEANAVFFGYEDQGRSWVCKVYLEFWDKVRRETRRTGSLAPQLLHLGVKWDPEVADKHEIARYDCHPMLGLRHILRRIAACYGETDSAALSALAQSIVRDAARRKPDASMLYLEVSERGNARASFDINLYKSGMRVSDAAPQLRQCSQLFELAPGLIEDQLNRLGNCALGHVSSGIDRHGEAFLSVYAETLPLQP